MALYPCSGLSGGSSGLPSCPNYMLAASYSKPLECEDGLIHGAVGNNCADTLTISSPLFIGISKATTVPSSMPSSIPSSSPSDDPSSSPSKLPSSLPSRSPSIQPSSSPTLSPSADPSSEPSSSPSHVLSDQPSILPSSDPSQIPSLHPSKEPGQTPSSAPSSSPSNSPTSLGTLKPSSSPSLSPSSSPSVSLFPSSSPTMQPTICGFKTNDVGDMISCGRYESKFTSRQSRNELFRLLQLSFHKTHLHYAFVPGVLFPSDLDCGGGYCDLSPNSQGNCACNCGENSCLQSIGGQDVGCELECICGAACSSTNFNDTGATCDDTACQDCSTTNTTCPEDTDCIINDGETDGKCVDSGLCTSAKKDLCDLAYASVSGSTNKRAKCW